MTREEKKKVTVNPEREKKSLMESAKVLPDKAVMAGKD